MTNRQALGAWAVILAGSDGSRLQPLITMIEGDTRPKQLCRILDNESLFTQTRRRIDPVFDSDRIIALVTKKHEEFYARDLNDWTRTTVIEQPAIRGTGIAIATAILTLRDLDPAAIVAMIPSDHHYGNEAAFLDVIEAGVKTAKNDTEAIVLAGAEATYQETEYSWIKPSEPFERGTLFEPTPVRRFWEKPTMASAQNLLSRGCLWNTFVTIGTVSTFVELLSEAAPNAMLTLSAGVLENNLGSSYRSVPPLDFSQDVLASQPECLLVIRDAASAWTDLGNPNRVLDTIKRQRISPPWLESIRSMGSSVASERSSFLG